MRVLVTSSRNPFTLDIVRKLGSTGHTVFASDTYGGAMGSHSKYAEGHLVTASPTFDTDQFIKDVSDFAVENQIDLIIPTFEEAFYLAARRADLPEGVEVFTGPFDKLAMLHDKVSFQRLCEDAGVPIPETVVATDEESLQEAISRFPRYFARAAFSRGGVALLTNTGPLEGAMKVEDCHPTPEQPWIIQPFVDGPMVCTYATVVDGKVTSMVTYRAPEQWAHSTGIEFVADDSTKTLEYTQKIVDQLDCSYSGQLSFDFVDSEGGLIAIECNPRTTNGVLLLETDEFVDALTGDITETAMAAPGEEREIKFAVLANVFTPHLKTIPGTVKDILEGTDTGKGWHDSIAMMWSPATLVHGAKLGHGKHEKVLEALGGDIVWDGGPIDGMTEDDAKALEAVHEVQL
ncbi:MAG: hypothetical protein WAS54_06330 [Scrofimicrobium sp.]